MQVFKLFYKLVNKQKGIIFMYLGIFLGVVLILASSQTKTADESFSYSSVKVAIIDRDGGILSREIKEYFKDQHEFKECEDNEDSILNELYWRKINYALIIPEGFEASLGTDSQLTLESMTVPDNFAAAYFESQINGYINNLTALVDIGYNLEDACELMSNVGEKKADVSMASYANTNSQDFTANFFMMIPYALITITISTIGSIMLKMNGKEVKARTECSSYALSKRTKEMALAIVSYGLVILLVLVAATAVFSKGALLTDVRAPLFILNALMMLIFTLSLAYFIGTISKTSNMVNGAVNTLSLALCFIGGVFVPQELFSDSVRSFARLIPTYWYVDNNSKIAAVKELSAAPINDILVNCLLLLSFAVALFAVTVVIQKNRRKTVG